MKDIGKKGKRLTAMDREKLNKAAENHFIDAVPYFHSSDTVRGCVVNAFKASADWLMQQPLSERLTEDEKRLIKALFLEHRNRAEYGVTHIDQIYGKAGMRILTQILEPTFFKEK